MGVCVVTGADDLQYLVFADTIGSGNSVVLLILQVETHEISKVLIIVI